MDSHYFPFCTSLPHPALFKPATLRTPSSTYCLQRSISLPGESGSFKLHLTDKPWPFLLKVPLSSPKGLCIPADLGSRSSLLFTLSTHLGDHT